MRNALAVAALTLSAVMLWAAPSLAQAIGSSSAPASEQAIGPAPDAPAEGADSQGAGSPAGAFTNALQKMLLILPYLAVLVAMMIAGKLVFASSVGYKFQDQLTVRDNPAVGVSFAGYLIGLGIALSGSLVGAAEIQTDPLDSLGTIVVNGALCILLMRLSIFVNDKLILYRFNVRKEMVEDRNAGTGFVVAGSCVATGLMLNGALTGQSQSLWQAIADICLYWALGQAILVVGGLVFRRIAHYDIRAQIAQHNNVAAGISFGGFLIAQGIIARASLAGAGGDDHLREVALICGLALAGLVLLVLVQVVAGFLFFARSPLSKEIAHDRNLAAGAVDAACFIGVAILVAAAIVHT